MVHFDLTGKVALVTGASKGLGEAAVRRLHEAGATTVVNFYPQPDGAQEELAKQVAASLGERAVAIGADVSKRADVERMIKTIIDSLGRLDIVVNNAGILRDRSLAKMTEEEWAAVLQTNLTGVFNVCQVAAKVLNEGGRVINIGSISGAMGFYGQANYAAAKAGVAAMGRVLSRELANRKINVNTVAPGVVLTEMGKSIPEAARAEMLKSIPLGRFGEPEEIANVILFLASDQSSYVTGQTIHVNGGWYA